MTKYQVIARKYRPQTFEDVIGQNAIVITLKNAIRLKRLAHAYLFCGPRGTGKTTIARIFAKAINCQNPTKDLEPCNHCASCQEITGGYSLDVLEIDGASNRGIDEIRKISESVGYASSSGKYKIVIIDEVHMLTKEAFNALLKTLEEPPSHAKFFFATTEPHKVLPTILSRCQRFNLNRISISHIEEKLCYIAKDLNIDIAKRALNLIAKVADGGLRDAESILDQIISFSDAKIDLNAVTDILGIMAEDSLFALDKAGKDGNINTAFELSHRIFTEGRDIPHFMDTLIEHFRNLLLVKIADTKHPSLQLNESLLQQYKISSEYYNQEQLIYILDTLSEEQSNIRFVSSQQISLELVLMKIIRSHRRLSADTLVKRLIDLEQRTANPSLQPSQHPPPTTPKIPQKQTPKTTQASSNERHDPFPPPPPKANLPVKNKTKAVIPTEKRSHYDTIMQFAAVELEGSIEKK